MKYFLYFLLPMGLCLGCSRPADPPNPAPAPGQVARLIQETFAGKPIVVAGSQRRNWVVAFERQHGGDLLDFQPADEPFPVIMMDQNGTKWDVLGRAVSGPMKGAALTPLNASMGFWFVFSASYPGLELHGNGTLPTPQQWDTLPGWEVPGGGLAQGADFDEIKALNTPVFIHYHPFAISPDDGFYLKDDDLVIAVRINQETKLYPHAILDWHEVINDEVGGVPVAVTYSPLTGTTSVWERDTVRYGVSGLIYNNNMLAFDWFTESYWWQLEGRSVFGGRKGERLALRHFVETEWGTWKRADPTPEVVAAEQGNSYPYGTYPYGDYQANSHITYPLLYEDSRLPPKERVFGIIVDGQCKVYQLSNF